MNNCMLPKVESINWFNRHINLTLCVIWLLSIIMLKVFVSINIPDMFTGIMYLTFIGAISVWCVKVKKRNYLWVLACLLFFPVWGILMLLLKNGK